MMGEGWLVLWEAGRVSVDCLSFPTRWQAPEAQESSLIQSVGPKPQGTGCRWLSDPGPDRVISLVAPTLSLTLALGSW